MVLKTTGLSPRFQRKIGLEKYAPSTEILAKMYPNLAFPAKRKKLPSSAKLQLQLG